MSRKVVKVLVVLASLTLMTASLAFSQDKGQDTAKADKPAESISKPEVIQPLHYDISPPLSEITPILPTGKEKSGGGHPVGRIPLPPEDTERGKFFEDPALQAAISPNVPTVNGLNLLGVGQSFVGPGGAFTVASAPPDTNASVGDTQVVQTVNSSFAVWNKSTGAIQFGPALIRTLFTGFPGQCSIRNDGDPIVLYDKLAKRWLISQFAVPGGAAGFHQCIAVSTTSNANGTYARYDFPYASFNDYPKFGVWPTGYFVSYNMFNGTTFAFQGARACAFDRARMLAGLSATQVCFQLSTAFGGLLPSDLDGPLSTPAGRPNYFLNFGTNSLRLWRFAVNFVTPALSTFTGPTSIPVAAFTPATCAGSLTCVPQPGTTQRLDTLGDRLMFRLAYRNRAGIETLVVNHSVNVSSGATLRSGVRWYEIRNPNAVAPTVFQQGTFSPDTNWRWMGSAAMDGSGNIAVGYSISNATTLRPSLRFAARATTDPLGTLSSEVNIFTGTGSQLPTLNRWGDYSSLSLDPVDDCTFWYTTEYLNTNGTFNWRTRLGSFRITTCVPIG
jgi:hypothetical protein